MRLWACAVSTAVAMASDSITAELASFRGNENEICRAVNCALRVLRARDRTNQRMSVDCKGQRSPRLLRSGRAANQPQQALCNAPNVLASARPTRGCSGRGERPSGRQDKQHLPRLLSRCRPRGRTSASRRLARERCWRALTAAWRKFRGRCRHFRPPALSCGGGAASVPGTM